MDAIALSPQLFLADHSIGALKPRDSPVHHQEGQVTDNGDWE